MCEKHASYKADALVVCCSDARIQKAVSLLLDERYGHGALIDRVVSPGATAYEQLVLEQVVELYGLHAFPEVVIVHHSGCGKLPNHEQYDHVEAMRNFASLLQERISVKVLVVFHHTGTKIFDLVETIYPVE